MMEETRRAVMMRREEKAKQIRSEYHSPDATNSISATIWTAGMKSPRDALSGLQIWGATMIEHGMGFVR
jgi:hypothetical protein